VPLIIGLVTDAITNKNMDEVIKYTVHWMFPIILGSAIFTWIRGTTFNTMGEKIAKEIRYDLFYFTINKDVTFFDENKTGAILSRISTDTSVI
jgi:ABC-type bacteriocin/lantibiotic exporter with double-glycine peptidase domain